MKPIAEYRTPINDFRFLKYSSYILSSLFVNRYSSFNLCQQLKSKPKKTLRPSKKWVS